MNTPYKLLPLCNLRRWTHFWSQEQRQFRPWRREESVYNDARRTPAPTSSMSSLPRTGYRCSSRISSVASHWKRKRWNETSKTLIYTVFFRRKSLDLRIVFVHRNYGKSVPIEGSVTWRQFLPRMDPVNRLIPTQRHLLTWSSGTFLLICSWW